MSASNEPNDRRFVSLRDVQSLKPGETVWDSSVAGFGIRRQQSEAVAYILRYRTQEGRQRWMTIGRHGSPWLPKDAREEARRLLGEVAKGHDPASLKAAKRQTLTVAELCDRYLQAAERGLIIGRRGAVKKATTLSTDRSRITAQIKPLIGSFKVPSITQQDMRSFMAAVIEGKASRREPTGKLRGLSNVRGGRGAAARTMGLLGAIFTYAVQQGLRTDNPVQGIHRPADGVRHRRLSDGEYGALADGLQGVSGGRAMHPPAVAAARFLALTGWRMGEALNLRWSDLDLSRRTAVLADSKSGRSIRPLSVAAVNLLTEQPRSSSLVFPAAKGDGTMAGFPKMFARIVAAGGLPADITPHVLRHSFASLAADLGYSDATIAQLVGHKGGGITRRYIHHADAVLLAAADAVANETANRMGDSQTRTKKEHFTNCAR